MAGTPGKQTLTEQLGATAPIQARRVDGGLAAPVGPPAASGGRPLPDDLRTSMERAFGADFSSVRVHEGPHAAAIGAEAFAQGEAIHFAPGRFDPVSPEGRELIGHELAHVVQQRAGRVSGGGVDAGGGAAINHDASLEGEADAAGAAAARGERAAAGPAGGTAPDDAPIQGNFGVELEVQNGWRVWWADSVEGKKEKKKGFSLFGGSSKEAKPRPVQKGTPIIPGTGFELQAEDSGAESAIEFVSNPPGFYTESEFKTGIGGMSLLAAQVAEAGKKEGTTIDPSTLGGSDKFRLVAGSSCDATMQITMGVPLASIPALFQLLPSLGGEYGQYAKAAEGAAKRMPQLEELLGEPPSGEVMGFYLLVRQYLVAAAHESLEKSFPKGVFKAMARTDFSKMFEMLGPQGQIIAKKMKQWIDFAIEGLPSYDKSASDRDQRVFKSRFNYDETRKKAPFQIATTRAEWLAGMPERDRLSKGGRELGDVRVPKKYKAPKDASKSLQDMRVSDEWVPLKPKEILKLQGDIDGLFEGMGGYGAKTDLVQYEGDKAPTEAVIIELRNPDPPGAPSKWEAVVTKYWDAMAQAIAHPAKYDDKKQEPVMEARSGFAMPQTSKQAKMREERGEKVIESLEALMISTGGKRDEKQRDEEKRDEEKRDDEQRDEKLDEDIDDSLEPELDVERVHQLVEAYQLARQGEREDSGVSLHEWQQRVVKLRELAQPLAKLTSEGQEALRYCEQTESYFQHLDQQALEQRERYAEEFKLEQGGSLSPDPEKLMGKTGLADALTHLAEVYRWQITESGARSRFITQVQNELFPDEGLGYKLRGEQDTLEARLEYYRSMRDRMRRIFQKLQRKQHGGEQGLVINVDM